MPSLIDLTGQRFVRLAVIGYVGRSRWSCVCDCGKSCEVSANHLRSGATLSCGCLGRERRAAAQAALVKPLLERFWKHVGERPEIGCWLWIGKRTHDGYGQIRLGGGQGTHVMAHRVSWELHFGEITNGLLVLHRCDTPSCVRPDHLFLGTHRDNTQDSIQKGRRPGLVKSGALAHSVAE